MELRKVTESDFEGIVRLVRTPEDLFYVYPKGIHPFSIRQLKHIAESRKELTVAVKNNEVVGFANLYNVELGKTAFIGNVVVSQDVRGQGYGRIIVRHMLLQAFEKYSVKEVRISVFSDNTHALLLYTNIGFMPYEVEERIKPSGARIGLIHMRIRHSE
ncbi:MAG: GNAT family N-acetyltransferase [Sedimenticola sp.]